jgi:hypothetical protein
MGINMIKEKIKTLKSILNKSRLSDYEYTLSRKDIDNIPIEYEAPNTPFVLDQRRSSMCVSIAFNTVRYMQLIDSNPELDYIFSPAYTYAITKRNYNNVYREGANIKFTCESTALYGGLPYYEFPGLFRYKTCISLLNENKTKYLERASHFKIKNYMRATTDEGIKIAIMKNKGLVVAVDDCYEFNNPVNGIIDYSNNTILNNNTNGHAVVICGWKYIDNKLYWRIQNSYGELYGNNGRAWIPEEYPWKCAPWTFEDNSNISYSQYKELYKYE